MDVENALIEWSRLS